MKRLLTLFFIGSFGLYAQQPPVPLVASRLADLSNIGSNYIANPQMGFDSRPPSEIQGELYLDDQWREGQIRFKDSQKPISELQLRYNLYGQYLEIKKGKELKMAQPFFLEGFSFQDQHGFQRNFVVQKEEGKDSYFEVLAEGPYSLLRKHFVKIIEPTYVPEFDTGSRDYKVNKEEVLYILTPHLLLEAKDLRKAENSPALKKYIRKNHLSLKQAHDLKKVIAFLNESNEKGATE